jgi:hypothetical protein
LEKLRLKIGTENTENGNKSKSEIKSSNELLEELLRTLIRTKCDFNLECLEFDTSLRERSAPKKPMVEEKDSLYES